MIALTREPTPDELASIRRECENLDVELASFRESKKRPCNLHEALQGKIPEALAGSLPRSFDIIGDIAVIDVPEELAELAEVLGNAVIALHPHVRLVLRKLGRTSGTYRTREYDRMAGHGGTETIHTEFSCRYRLDVASVYFNPRLSHERMRVAKQVKQGEVVVDMFAGVGPYSILIAKRQPQARIIAIDINPEAYNYLEENILLNGVADRVTPLLGDSKQFSGKLGGAADRIIMNFPSAAKEYLGAAVQMLSKNGGTIHYYAFCQRDESVLGIEVTVRSMIESYGRKIESFTHGRIMKEVAPNRAQVALDIHVF